PSNDVDIYAHDLGYIAIVRKGKLVGFNVTVGGGMGMSHGKEKTYPRLADVLGFCTVEQAVEVAEKVVLVQRDHGDREDRLHARLKYTIEDRGIKWFKAEVEKRLGWKFGRRRTFTFDHNGDRYGWVDDANGNSHYTLFIQNGRVLDRGDEKLRTGLREIAEIHEGDFRLTANQNVIIANVSPEKRPEIEALLKKHRIDRSFDKSGLRVNSMACVALPTCGLALAESERYLPDLVTQLDEVIEAAGLKEDAITIRMTGCPNGCARPYIAEIAMVGRAPGKYNLYLGGGFVGDRLNKLYKASVQEDQLVPLLKPLIESYAKERESDERFGDFVIRQGVVKPTKNGKSFHKELFETAVEA
ncbi:MAG: NADPH-dependent assimilatory sulfite reductase hemoprotein subunit, partial [Verrucomicrobiota bacterium]